MSKNKKNSIIESMGVYLPPKEVTTEDIIDACKEPLDLPLARLTGIKSRHVAGETEFAIDMARHAIENCLARSKYHSDDIELLVCCNISRYDGPNFQFSFEPSTAVRLREYFDMPYALCFDISNACAGMLTGVNIADAFLKAGVVKNAMVVSGEYITHLAKTAQQEIIDTRDERLACLTLGDSGAALILEQTDNPDIGFHEIDMYTLSLHSGLCTAKTTDSPAGGAIMFTDSATIHSVCITETVKFVADVLKRNQWTKDKLHHYIGHQTARAAISEMAKQFNAFSHEEFLGERNLVYNLEDRGNTSTTTHFLAIWDNIQKGRIQNGDNALISSQASGITLGNAPYTFDDLPERLRKFEESGVKPSNKKAITGQKATFFMPKIRVRIESLGTIQDTERALIERAAISIAAAAADDCFRHSKYSKSEIELLIHAGVHREEFLSEPAIATLVAGKLEVNPNPVTDKENRTFAYDIINGAVGFLNACQNGVSMICSGKFKNAMILASEIENNRAEDGRLMLGLKETGSTTILDSTPEGEETGFLSFSFQYFTRYVDKYYSKIGQENGVSYLDFRKDPRLNEYFLECIQQAVDKYLKAVAIGKDKIKAVFPPQISKEFVESFQNNIGFDAEKVVAIANSHDFFTSSTVYSMQTALDRGQVEKGDVGLIVNVGTGIQVGCALYQF